MAELYADRNRPGAAEGRHAGEKLIPGYGHYPSYHALWHLREIKVVSDLATFASAGWDEAAERIASGAKRTRVALVDTSVAYDHPNLQGAILKELMIDFFSARLGTFPCPKGAARPEGDAAQSEGDAARSERDAAHSKRDVTRPKGGGSPHAEGDDAQPEGDALDHALAGAGKKRAELEDERVLALFDALVERLPLERAAAAASDLRTPRHVHPATSPTFSGHGTAMAGLIGARPRGPKAVKRVDTRHIGGEEGQPAAPGPERTGFPYAGVDPFCEIVPISTSFDPDPEQLLLAMLYAWLIEADVIVLARDFPDPIMSTITGRLGPDLGIAPEDEQAILRAALPTEPSAEELALWAALRAVTLHLAQTVPIVCAAGNGGDRTLILPAALADPGNGIIAVGARAATGQPAGYSSAGGHGDGTSRVTLFAPSGDGERLDRHLQRLDTADPDFRPDDHGTQYRDRLGIQHPPLPDREPPEVTASIFATQEIITTDVPGAAGYNSSAFARFETPDGSVLDYRSYYCRFSGTSAAAAIAAGMLSLAISAGRIDRRAAARAKTELRGTQGPTDEAKATPFLDWTKLPPQRS